MMARPMDAYWQELVAQADAQDIRELAMCAIDMRGAQRNYFNTRDHLNLVQAKSAESRFDDKLKVIRNRHLESKQ